MNEKLKDNPFYQNGYFWGQSLIPHISKTIYGNLENALLVKEELLEDLRKELDWSDDKPKVSELLGMIDALKEALVIEKNNHIYTTNELLITFQNIYGIISADIENNIDELLMIVLTKLSNNSWEDACKLTYEEWKKKNF